MNSSYYQSTTTENERQTTAFSIASIQELRKQLANCKEDTLLVLDVDEVLVTTQDIFLKPELEAVFLGMVKKRMEAAKDQKERDEIEEKLSISLTQSKRLLVESEWPEFIQELQAKKIKILALTSHPTGKFGHVEDVACWKVDSLQAFGISFEKAFSHTSRRLTLETLTKPGIPSPIYERGVLFSRGFSKGEVLCKFLATVSDWQPKQVVMVDDLLKNHETMQAELAKSGIDYKGYYYTKAHLQKAQIDAELVTFQFHYLMEHAKWLSDSEARSLKAPGCLATQCSSS